MALQLIDIHSGIKPTNLQQMMGDELENSFKRVRNKYAEPQEQAKLAESQAHANYYQGQADRANNPMQSLTGIPAEVAGYEHLQKIFQNNPEALRRLEDRWNLRDEGQRSTIESREHINANRVWPTMPSDEKTSLLAAGRGLGIPENEIIDAVNQHKSLDQLARERGFSETDIENNIPKNVMTRANVTSQKNREAASAAVQNLGPKISKAMKPYVRTFAGKSPQFVIESLQNKNPKGLGEYLAGLAMQPEYGSLRLRSLGATSGHHTLQDMSEKALGNAKIYQSLVSPEVYQHMQTTMDEWIADAYEAENKSFHNKVAKKIEANNDDPFGILE